MGIRVPADTASERPQPNCAHLGRQRDDWAAWLGLAVLRYASGISIRLVRLRRTLPSCGHSTTLCLSGLRCASVQFSGLTGCQVAKKQTAANDGTWPDSDVRAVASSSRAADRSQALLQPLTWEATISSLACALAASGAWAPSAGRHGVYGHRCRPLSWALGQAGCMTFVTPSQPRRPRLDVRPPADLGRRQRLTPKSRRWPAPAPGRLRALRCPIPSALQPRLVPNSQLARM